MIKWTVKTIEPVIEYNKDIILSKGYNEVKIEADGVDIVKEGGVVIFFNVVKEPDEVGIRVNKRVVKAVFSVRNIISIIKEEPTNA